MSARVPTPCPRCGLVFPSATEMRDHKGGSRCLAETEIHMQRRAKENKAKGDRECRHCYSYESEHATMRSHKFEAQP